MLLILLLFMRSFLLLFFDEDAPVAAIGGVDADLGRVRRAGPAGSSRRAANLRERMTITAGMR